MSKGKIIFCWLLTWHLKVFNQLSLTSKSIQILGIECGMHALIMPAPGHINALGTAAKHLDANGKFLSEVVRIGPRFSQKL